MRTREQSVLVVGPSAYPLGGVASWIDYLLPGLEAKGWRVTLGLLTGPRYHRPDRYLEVHPFVRWVPIRCITGTRYGRVDAVRKILRRLKPDVVLTANVPDAVIAGAMERSRGKLQSRIVMSCHAIEPFLFADMRRLGDVLDQVACTNVLACRLAESVGGMSSQRVHHAPCGTAVPDRLSARAGNFRFTIVYAGRLEQNQKRVLDLARIGAALMAAGVDFTMKIAGTGPDEHGLKAELTALGLMDRYDFMGHVEPGDLNRKLYCSADALLVTSRWETGPMVVWEAMAAGLPVVTSRYLGIGSERILFHRTNCLMFDVGDCDAAARQLACLASDRRLADTLRVNAFSDVSEKLTIACSTARWDHVLCQATSLEPRPASTGIGSESDVPAGRLDRWLGPAAAESLRGMARLAPDTGPAGEWPHTLGGATMSDEAFWLEAGRLDSDNPAAPAGTARAGTKWA